MEHLYLQIKHFQDHTIGKEILMDMCTKIIVIISNLIMITLNFMAKPNTLIKLEIIHIIAKTMEVFLIINKMDPNTIKIQIILMITVMVMVL